MSYGNPAPKSRVAKTIPKASNGTGANNGTGTPTEGFRTALVILDLGTLGASATVDVKIQESDSLASGYTDIAGAVFPQQVKATDDDKVLIGDVNLWGKKRFLRAVATVGAAASVVGVTFVLTDPDRDERVTGAQFASGAVTGPNTTAAIAFTGV